MPRQAPAAAQTLDERIHAALDGFQGKAWIYAKNLDTGKDYSLRADEQTRTASTIKLGIMAETFHQVAQGKLKWDDEIVLTKEKKQGGSGILFEFSDNTKIDLQTALHLMIVVSDNTATNLVLDKVGTDNVNDFMDSLGLTDIKSMRKIGGGNESKAYADPRNKLFGLGRSSPRQMVKLIEMMDNGHLVSKDASAEMINILKRQQYKDGIGRGVPDTIPVASKSGTLRSISTPISELFIPAGAASQWRSIWTTCASLHTIRKTRASRCFGSFRRYCRTDWGDDQLGLLVLLRVSSSSVESSVTLGTGSNGLSSNSLRVVTGSTSFFGGFGRCEFSLSNFIIIFG